MQKTPSSLQRINDFDLSLCLRFNRLVHIRFLRHFFFVVSRLGNGVFWYALMGLMLLAEGLSAAPTVARMLVSAIVALQIYRWLKQRTSRPRPYQVYSAISAAAPVLDRFSFPSGHTMHAVSFSLLACASYPQLAPLLYPFAILVGASRPILGLHYPSDVIAGAIIGGTVAYAVSSMPWFDYLF